MSPLPAASFIALHDKLSASSNLSFSSDEDESILFRPESLFLFFQYDEDEDEEDVVAN